MTAPPGRRAGVVCRSAAKPSRILPTELGPKVKAAIQFVLATGGRTVISSLDQIEAVVAGDGGTLVLADGAAPK